LSKYRRSRVELYVDVLKAISKGKRSPSRIVYSANLSYDRVTKCINFLEEQRLINRTDKIKKRYETTRRGMETLQYFHKLENNLFNNVKETLKTL